MPAHMKHSLVLILRRSTNQTKLEATAHQMRETRVKQEKKSLAKEVPRLIQLPKGAITARQ